MEGQEVCGEFRKEKGSRREQYYCKDFQNLKTLPVPMTSFCLHTSAFK